MNRDPPARLTVHDLDVRRLTVGLTVPEVARLYRVSRAKALNWIKAGELRAINTADALCAKPRWVILPDALAEFERRRAGGPPPKTARRRKRSCTVDYFPD